MLRLTADHIRRSIGTTGRSWLDTVDDPGSRVQRGQWPASEPRWTFGDPQWAEEREEARKRAWSLQDPEERAAARAAVEAEYGPAPSTSKALNSAPDPSARVAAEQRTRLDAAGLRVSSSYAPSRRA